MRNRFILYLYLGIVAMQAHAQNYITLDGKQFKLNGANFYPVIMNYGVSSQYRLGSPNLHYLGNEKDYDMNWFSECNDQAGCSADRRRHFRQLKRKGFNTIRIIMHGQLEFINLNNTCVLQNKTVATWENINNNQSLPDVITTINQPYLR